MDQIVAELEKTVTLGRGIVLVILIITIMTLITIAGVRLVSFFNYAAVIVLLFLIAALTFYNFNFFSSGLGFSIQALFAGFFPSCHFPS